MVEGVVNSRLEAVISLSLSGPLGSSRDVEAVVDTGFSEFLIVPPELAMELGLAFGGVTSMILADGEKQFFEYYKVSVVWDGGSKPVRAHVADGTPLIGMSLLHCHRLDVEVVEGGRVLVEGLNRD